MKKLTLAEWQNKYVAGPIERFDQKNHMFNRPTWDPEIKELLEDWSFSSEARDKPGYTLQDQALQRAASAGTQLALFNTSKPNPSPVSRAIMEAMMGGTSPRPAMDRGPLERPKVDTSNPEILTRDIKKVATYFGADLVGICRLDRRLVYSHTYEVAAQDRGNAGETVAGESKPQEIPQEYEYAVAMAFEEDYDMMKYFPTYLADAPVGMGYSRMAIANAHLSAFIRNLGYKAIDCSTNDVALSIPTAMQAGLGDHGRNGLLITPQFGPRVRLSKVITDLPLVADSPIDFGVTEFCAVCKKCADLCPSRAITFGERTTEPNNISNAGGAIKWRIDAVKCRVYWSRVKKGCTICVACCPYNKADTWFHRTVRWFTDYARWGDALCVRMDDLFGYGKEKKAGDFWEGWQPRRH